MKRLHTTDFDVITGPFMASACPIVDTIPPAEIPAPAAIDARGAAARTEPPATAQKADAA